MTSQTDAAQRRYDEPRGRNYRIDMTRGKPSPEQAELSNPVLTILDPDDCLGDGGDHYWNYSPATGIPEAKRLLVSYMDMPPDQIIAAGNSSLQLTHDVVAWSVLKGGRAVMARGKMAQNSFVRYRAMIGVLQSVSSLVSR